MGNTLLSDSNQNDPERIARLAGGAMPEPTKQDQVMSDQEDKRRAWLWADVCPQGQVFKGAEIDEALEEGWVDSPDKVGTVAEDETPAPVANPVAEPIQDNGGGWFTVTHGDQSKKVQGRDNAEAKLAEFQAATE